MFQRLVHPRADRLLVVFSDVEMGAGGVTDDFPHSDWLGELLLTYNQPPFQHIAVELVFNGDIFDLLKTSWNDEYPRHISAEVALGKLRRIANAHTPFFAALREFLAFHKAERRVHFVIGNHDLELLFPEVQQAIRHMLNDDPRVSFPGFELSIGDVHIEHGHQLDGMFHVDEPWFVEYRGEQILRLPWASVALLDVALPLQHILYHHDRLKPREELFALLPEMREAVINAFWSYWLNDWAPAVWRQDDPVKGLSWTMLREVAYRFRTGDPDISVLRQHFEQRLRDPGPYRVFVVGHEHRPTLLTYGDRRFLLTGAFRNEYMLEQGGRVQRPVPKTWAEIFLDNGRSVASRLVDIDGPPPPPGYIPDSIFNVLEPVQAYLASSSVTERKQLEAEQHEQAAREAAEDPD